MLADYSLFLDDERQPGKDLVAPVVIVRDFWAFKKTLIELGIPRYITFDHDLGGEYTGKSCAEFLAFMLFSMDDEEEAIAAVKELEWDVHSANPIGAMNIRLYLKSAFEEILSWESQSPKRLDVRDLS